MTSQILLVDDDPDILESYVLCLNDVYRVIAVQSGRDAIERVKRTKDIDCAIIDYRLFDMSGIEVMKEIKDIDPSVPVIIVTGYGDEQIAVEAFRAGARDYLKKPLSISELSAKIDFFLALRANDKKQRKNVIFKDSSLKGREAPPPAVTQSHYIKIQHAVRFINDNYRTDICLDKAAKEAGMSPTHFSRIFKKVMGTSFQAYLTRRRIAKAENLLLTSVLSISEIAYSVGFTDITSFGKIFREQTGHTPTLFRNLPKK